MQLPLQAGQYAFFLVCHYIIYTYDHSVHVCMYVCMYVCMQVGSYVCTYMYCTRYTKS